MKNSIFMQNNQEHKSKIHLQFIWMDYSSKEKAPSKRELQH